MKKLVVLLTSFLMCVSLAGCGGSSKDDSKDKTLTVYTPNSEALVQATIPGFEKATGIKVELVQAGTGELFKKIQAEAGDPQADIIFGGSYATYAQNKDLFADYTSKNNSLVNDEFQNKNGFTTSYVLDGSVILVNKKLAKEAGIEIKGYKDLLNPALKGKIISGDPSASSSAFAHLTNMLLAMGGYENKDAWDYVKDLYTNIDGKIASSSNAVYKGVADGEYMVGLTWEDPAATLVKDGADVEIVYMSEGTVFLPAGSAIIKNCKHEDNAKQFIDYITSQEAQDTYGTQTTNRPVLKEVKVGDYMKPMKDIKTIEEDRDYVLQHKNDIIEKYKDIYATIQSNK